MLQIMLILLPIAVFAFGIWATIHGANEMVRGNIKKSRSLHLVVLIIFFIFALAGLRYFIGIAAGYHFSKELRETKYIKIEEPVYRISP